MQRAATETEAASGALAHVSHPPIVDINAAVAAAIACRTRFGDVRDAVLREYPWNFAGAWMRPAREPAPALGPLKNRFALPPDCVAVRAVDGLKEDEWAVEGAAVNPGEMPVFAMVLVTNAPAPLVHYTRIVENPALWDALFLSVFQLRLGAAIAPFLAKDRALANDLTVRADLLIAKAKRADAKERARTEIPRTTSWLRARR
ncbi:hypothetical protein [Chelatococcus asaccharovorans]|uniref:Uncharacterized protein n=1 Tax=Chelatococcus asaccharovorans TaxID=28210 RepID=A0A2V3UAJ1_9HYPH|nr:hypothetical protein [Chelatococcus asaccharovorans]MBS7703176.1 hypothetical protein [Chelatococcus asaccharovorans]PXW61505.1 hypothetical protein C7450_10320 [Chelatococcus asaccharovorans]